MPEGFLPEHGGYRNLRSYQQAEIIYDATVYFCQRWLRKGDRTIGQMFQAARSGKQNIVEGSMASATSKESEIKLTNVARASLAELEEDYQDFLRTRSLGEWPKNHRYVEHLRKLIRDPAASYLTFKKGVENEDPEIAANVILGLIRATSYLLRNQIREQEQESFQQGASQVASFHRFFYG